LEFPAPQNPDEYLAPLDWGVRRQPDGTLRILTRPDPSLPSLEIVTTLPYSVFVEQKEYSYELECTICKQAKKVDQKTYSHALSVFSYTCEECKTKPHKSVMTLSEAAKVLPEDNKESAG
jgi:hypothetical protein